MIWGPFSQDLGPQIMGVFKLIHVFSSREGMIFTWDDIFDKN
jgi:hypothetical protein